LKSRPSFAKRSREQQRAERQKEKAERREVRKTEKLARPASDEPGVDPVIAGIVPGPQLLDPDLFGATSLTDD
jgi:hypothetical protein